MKTDTPAAPETALQGWRRSREPLWSYHQLARAIGIDTSYAQRLCRGLRRPSLALAVHIEQVTGGAVSVQSWAGPATPTGSSINET